MLLFTNYLSQVQVCVWSFLIVFGITFKSHAQNACNCTDYLIINDPADDVNGFVHKFRINADSTFTEIFSDPPTNSQAWIPPGAGLNSPHGLGVDLNGYYYIGGSGSGIRKIDCDGNLFPTSEFHLGEFSYNLTSHNGILYSNPDYSGNDARITAYDPCDGSSLGYIQLDTTGVLGRRDWGFEISEDGTFYVSSGYDAVNNDGKHYIYRFMPSLSDFTANTTYSPIISSDDFPTISNRTEVFGITSDPSGNIYIVIWDYCNNWSCFPNHNTWILKFDAAGTLLASTSEPHDGVNGGIGYSGARGIKYYDELDLLFLSGLDDCVALVDPNTLNYIGTGIGYVAGQNPKALAIATECCPVNNNLTVDTTLCTVAVNDKIFLQELINCGGTICEGQWVEGMSNSGMSFDTCDNSITITSLDACGSFTLSSNGTGNNPQCGAFTITLNVNVAVQPEAKVFAFQPSCTNGSPNNNGYLQLSEITSGKRFNWSVGSTYTGDPDFVDATDTIGLTFPISIVTGLSNPTGFQDYTIRIFSDTSACGEFCFTDYTVSMNEQDCTVGCNCSEQIYLNDAGVDHIEKFTINADSSLHQIGSPWLDAGAVGLTSPHGVAIDNNGFLYITDLDDGDVMKLDCDGNIIDNQFIDLNQSVYNYFAIGNNLYLPNSTNGEVQVYDLCTGLQTHCISHWGGWGNTVGPNGLGYSSKGYDGNGNSIHSFPTDTSVYDAPSSCGWVSTEVIGEAAIHNAWPTPNTSFVRPMGIVFDGAGNLYVVVNEGNFAGCARIQKYDSNFNYVSQTAWDCDDNDGGWAGALGLIWGEESNLLYVSANDDCIAVFDTSLNYLPALTVPFPVTPGTYLAKAIGKVTECCPTNNNITIDTIICSATIGDEIFLQELINCTGTICEGVWTPGGSNSNLTYDVCENSVTIDALIACGTFTLESDGTGVNAQCGAFKITVNINVENQPEAQVFAIQPSCTNSSANSDGYLQISEITSGRYFNWSLGSTYTGSTAIADAMDSTGMSFPIKFAAGQSNPSGSQDYTIRIFSDTTACGGSCYTDYTVTMQEQDCTVGCSCTNYLYLNDPQGSNDLVHKFAVDGTGVMTEIDNPWMASGTIVNPHGPAIDLNGFLYFANAADNGDIIKANCNGDIIDPLFISGTLSDGSVMTLGNIRSKDGILYVMTRSPHDVAAIDLCTGDLIGKIGKVPIPTSLSREAWGFHIDDTHWYATLREEGLVVSGSLDTSLYTIPSTNAGAVLFTPMDGGGSPVSDLMGITRDSDGNFFIITNQTVQGSGSQPFIRKYDSAGNHLVSVSDNTNAFNSTNGQQGFWGVRGLVYDADTDLLYVGNKDNCVTVFDTDLVEQTSLNIGNPTNGLTKGIALIKECCPISNNVTIDTTLCAASVSDVVFLQELINCEGTICEGIWQEGMSNSGLTFNSCNNSVTIDALSGCGTFTLESDGTGNNPQCGAFVITVNISVNVVTASVVAADQTLCAPADPAAFTVTTPATGGTLTYQWQSSTTNCNSGFSDIASANSATYDPPAGLMDTTYYRVIVNSANAGCASGNCADTSNCITVSILPTPTASVFAIQPSCDAGAIQTNGYLQISAFANGDKYNFVTGSDYIAGGGDPDYVDALPIGGLPFKFNQGISNPAGSQDYTIRIFNSNGCFTDYTVTMNQQDCAFGCNCEENLYLNETTSGGSVHKFEINPDGTLTEIGMPWYDNAAAGGELISPHGLASDLNGYLYIGESNSASEIRRFTCDGEILPESEFAISTAGQFNMGSIGNTLYVGERDFAGIVAYDLCTGAEVSRLQFCENTGNLAGNWGFFIDPVTEQMYATQSQTPWVANRVWSFDESQFTSSGLPCVSSIDTIRNDANSPLRDARFMGITTDPSGSIYIVVDDDTNYPGDPSYVLKYGPGPFHSFIAMSPLDSLADGTGFNDAHAIVYSETSGRIYVSTNSAFDDCVAIFDTDLNYIEAAVPSPGDGSQAKGMTILKECCPINNNVTIDTTICLAALNDSFYLQEFINCSGIICEGMWTEDGSNTGLSYNSCGNTVKITALDACGTFTLESDGTGSNAQCGAFVIAVNIKVNVVAAPTYTVATQAQSVCVGDDPIAFVVDAPASGGTLSYQWQSSTTDCSSGFVDISGANSATYDAPSSLTDTTYYRVIVNSANATCTSGLCADTSSCLTINVETCCTGTPYIGPDQAICSGDTITFIGYPSQANQTDSITGNWTISPQSPSTVNVTTVTNDSVIQVVFYAEGLGPFIDTVYFETAAGCMDTALMVVNTRPIFIGRDTTVCANSTVDLTSLVENYGSIQTPVWHIAAVDGSVENTPMAVMPASPTDYFLIGNNVHGCKDTVLVSVLHFTAPVVILANDSICPGLQGTLDAGTHTSYLWSTGATTQTLTVSLGTYTVTVTDGNTCTASATAQVVNYNPPNLTYLQITDNSGIANDSVVCSGENLNFGTNVDFGTGTIPYTIAWTADPSGNATFLGATDELFAGATFTNATTSPVSVSIKINVSDANGCLDSLSVPITVRPQLGIDTINRYDMSGTPFDGGICFGDSVLFDVVPEPPGPYTFLWSTGSTNDSVWVQPPYVDTNTVYFVTISDTYGCTSASFTSAKGIPEMFSTTTFIPACSSSEMDTLLFSTSGGVPAPAGYQYTISTLGLPEFHNGDWKLPINVAVGNTVTVNVKDEKGCPIDTLVTIPAHTDLLAFVDSEDCMDNGTAANVTDDYFVADITVTNAAGGPSGKYVVLYNGTILNPGGTNYGTSAALGLGKEFDADGTSTYTVTVQDFDAEMLGSDCQVDVVLGPVAECSDCPAPVCLPVQVLKN